MPCGCGGSNQPAPPPGADQVAAGGGAVGNGDYYWNGPTVVDSAKVAEQPPQPSKPAA